MRFLILFFTVALLAGCAKQGDDARLQGTWHSNLDATMAMTFQLEPQLTNSPPEKIQGIKDMFDHLTVTYSHGVSTSDYRGKVESFHYRVVKLGPDYDIVRYEAGSSTRNFPWSPAYQGVNFRIRFMDGDKGYWSDTVLADVKERFDKVTTPSNKAFDILICLLGSIIAFSVVFYVRLRKRS